MNTITNQIRMNKWRELDFRDSERELIRLRRVEIYTASSLVSEKVRTLRTHDTKKLKESRQAALFCYGVKKAVREKVYYSMIEDEDYDFVAYWKKDETQHFAPTQIKEIVPAKLNPKQSIDEEIKKLKKYKGSDDLSVIILINREIKKLDLLKIDCSELSVKALWIYGCVSRDQSTWFLSGNFIESNPYYFEYEYPEIN